MIQVLYSSFAEIKEDDLILTDMLSLLPEKMRSPILRYKRKEDRFARLIGKLLIQKGFEQLGISGEYSIEAMEYTSFGRPFFPGASLDFNVSHSEECVVCAMSLSCRLGIDIEYVKPIAIEDFYDNMKKEEWLKIHSFKDKLDGFYRYWTEKESVIKANGKGLSLPLKDFMIEDNRVYLEDVNWFVREIEIGDDYICHLATDDRGKELEVVLYPIKYW